MNKLYNIAVVDDNDESFETLCGYFDMFSKENNRNFQVTRFKNGEKFLHSYTKKDFDIVLMDIDLPGMNGMDTVKKLREIDQDVTVVFVTSLAQYAVAGYEVNAFDFIVKPFTYYHFSVKMRRVINRFEGKRDVRFWINVTGSGKKEINSATLKYVEVMKHNVIYHTEEGDFVTLGSMLKAQEQLKEASFALCNRCYLLNLKYVTGVHLFEVIVGGETLQISHLKRNEFLEELNHYISGGAPNV